MTSQVLRDPGCPEEGAQPYGERQVSRHEEVSSGINISIEDLLADPGVARGLLYNHLRN